jgi:DNA-binding MarR family transcriptional regulator
VADQTLLNDTRDFWWTCVDRCVIRDKDLSPIDKTVYAVLCSFASTYERKCFPKVATIAAYARCSVRSNQESLTRLQSKKYLRRTPRYKNKRQLSSEYTLIGHRARNASPTRAHDVHQGGAPKAVAELESLELDTSLSEKREKFSPEARPSGGLYGTSNAKSQPTASTQYIPKATVELEEVPQVMRATAEYFLLKTGRKEITLRELSAIKALEKIHVPARVNHEIAKAVSRYEKRKRPLHTLTLEYIYESLKYQTSGRRGRSETQRALTSDDPYEKQRASDLKEWEASQQKALLEKYGGELP